MDNESLEQIIEYNYLESLITRDKTSEMKIKKIV